MLPEISGDIRLSIGDRLRYLWRNSVRNLQSLWQGPATRSFHCTAGIALRICGQSPSRYLTEAFIATRLPRLLPTADTVEILEIGCGSGSMASRLERLGYRGNYVGVDVRDRFRPATGAISQTFVCSDAHDFVPGKPIDLLISVSALEHIPRDADLIQRLSRHMAPAGVQLHFVPASAGLIAYLWHGYRQYSPVALAERFGPQADIIRLGGFASLILHVVVISPEMLFGRFIRSLAPGLYAKLLRAALTADRALPFCPTAYAVVRRH
jgi:SAM-dependent methyltransferase